MRTTGPSAAIAAIVAGIQGQGLWAGRRQLFVRFAAEAETATLYSPEMLARALERALAAGGLHSVSLSGKDPAGCASFIAQTWSVWSSPLPAMLDGDGQHPDAVAVLARILALVQVTVTLNEPPAFLERAVETLRECARLKLDHALVIAIRDTGPDPRKDLPSDDVFARFVEEMHRASPGTKLVVHPAQGADRGPFDRRYATMVERAAAIHGDVMLSMRIPIPTGVR
ncbi:MAG: hypothetical protein M3081_10170 [Gemmatimonadota bacterium]|nr:hypothetical protein [Gemmatimonadota bacterium]